jgi:hypothetical protein
MNNDILKETSGFCVGLIAAGFGVAGAGFAALVSGAALLAVGAAWYSEHSAARRHVEAAQREFRVGFLRARGLDETDVAAMDVVFQ